MYQHASPLTLGNFEEILADFLPTFICQVYSNEWDPDLILPFFVFYFFGLGIGIGSRGTGFGTRD